jgi:hypothetical protein
VKGYVVEAAKFAADLHDVVATKNDIGQAHPADKVIPFTNGGRAQVDTDELAFRPLERNRDEVCSLAASELEHPAGVETCGVHPEQRTKRRELIRMGLHEWVAGIANVIVGRRRYGRRVAL